MVNYPYFLMYATGEKMNITQIEGSYPQIPIADKEERRGVRRGTGTRLRRSSRNGSWSGSRARTSPSRRRSTSPTGTRPCTTSTTPSARAPSCRRSGASSAGGRRTTSTTCPTSSSHATGFELDDDALWEIARRNRTLVRALNVRRGLRRSDEKPPEDHWKKRDPENGAEAPRRVLRVQGLDQRRHPDQGDAGRAGSGLRERRLRAAGHPDRGREARSGSGRGRIGDV